MKTTPEASTEITSQVLGLYHCLYLRRWLGAFQEAVYDIPEMKTYSVSYRFLNDPAELNQVLGLETPSWRLDADALLRRAVLVRWVHERRNNIYHTTILTNINRSASRADILNGLNRPPVVTYNKESPILIADLAYSSIRGDPMPQHQLSTAAFSHVSIKRWLVVPYLLNSVVVGRVK